MKTARPIDRIIRLPEHLERLKKEVMRLEFPEHSSWTIAITARIEEGYEILWLDIKYTLNGAASSHIQIDLVSFDRNFGVVNLPAKVRNSLNELLRNQESALMKRLRTVQQQLDVVLGREEIFA